MKKVRAGPNRCHEFECGGRFEMFMLGLEWLKPGLAPGISIIYYVISKKLKNCDFL